MFWLLYLCCVESLDYESTETSYLVDTANIDEIIEETEPATEYDIEYPETTKVYIATDIVEADVTLSPALNNYSATCKIYITESSYTQEPGVWKVVQNKYLADKSIYFYDLYNNSATLQYMFVNTKTDAYCDF